MGITIKIDGAGDAIRTLREASGLTLQGLAERVGWDRGRLSKYENNRLGLSISVIEEIARALGEPSLAVVLLCLKQRYPELSNSKAGKLVEQLVEEVSNRRRRC